ncbi:YcxB family protein [Micromonospora yasonensis]|uniref:YcxB family protein n=1 Tax=Micromonospora yasonensis TaxID=1128667 RepID=UPI00223146DC|nr:YcxB family protein [Micromonospora yasonensis]MCW3839721.1 YcxB family protein [Micromonospora yasonensis]
MQQQPLDTVEVTTQSNRRDFRRTLCAIYQRKIAWLGVAGAATALAGVLALCAELPIVAGICFIGVVIAWTYRWWRIELEVRRLPPSTYGPTTFRISEEGVEMETTASRRLVRWVAMYDVLVTPHAFFFPAPGHLGIVLHRRTLSESDTSAIEAAIRRHREAGAGRRQRTRQ